MTRSELVRAIAERHGLPRRAADAAVGAILDGLSRGLADGRRVEIRGFGTLHTRRVAGYRGRNPRSGAGVEVPPKFKVVFRPSGALLARVAGDEEG